MSSAHCIHISLFTASSLASLLNLFLSFTHFPASPGRTVLCQLPFYQPLKLWSQSHSFSWSTRSNHRTGARPRTVVLVLSPQAFFPTVVPHSFSPPASLASTWTLSPIPNAQRFDKLCLRTRTTLSLFTSIYPSRLPDLK